MSIHIEFPTKWMTVIILILVLYNKLLDNPDPSENLNMTVVWSARWLLSYTENKHLLIQQMYDFQPTKSFVKETKKFVDFSNVLSISMKLSFTKSFVTPTNLLFYLTKLFVGWKSMHTFVKSTNVYFECTTCTLTQTGFFTFPLYYLSYTHT
jgi:hypothetical protein